MYKFTSLAEVIADIESTHNPARLRFEPALYARLQHDLVAPDAVRARRANVDRLTRRIMVANVCSRDTAVMIAASSWGEWQILGENIYDTPINCDFTIARFLADEAYQARAFEIFCAVRTIFYTLDELRDSKDLVRRFAAAYNGPGNVDDYSARIAQRLAVIV